MNLFGDISLLSDFIRRLICCSSKCGDKKPGHNVGQSPVTLIIKDNFCCTGYDSITLEIDNNCCKESRAFIEIGTTCCQEGNGRVPVLNIINVCCEGSTVSLKIDDPHCTNEPKLVLNVSCCTHTFVSLEIENTCCDTGYGETKLEITDKCCGGRINITHLAVDIKCCTNFQP